MPDALMHGQHISTTKMDVHLVAKELVAGLGPTLVAALTGSKDTKLPSKWARPSGPSPSVVFARRLRLGHRVWRVLVQEEGEAVARSWFIGGNPLLAEKTPLTAIREDRGAAVIRAVEAFLHDEPDT